MSEILRTAESNGSVYPRAFSVLSNLPVESLLHKEYDLRHPLSIYARSIANIFKYMNKVLTLLKPIYYGNGEGEILEIENKYKDLLFSLMSHIDDCFLILKALHPSYNEKKYTFAHTWLEKNNHPTYDDFYKGIQKYRNEISYFVNKIKHNNERLKVVVAKNDDITVVGYTFFELHYNERATVDKLNINKVKSINNDLKYNLYNVYLISELLSTAIIDAIKITLNQTVEEVKHSVNDDFIKSIVHEIKNLDYNVFNNYEFFSPKTLIDIDGFGVKLVSNIGGFTMDGVSVNDKMKLIATNNDHQIFISVEESDLPSHMYDIGSKLIYTRMGLEYCISISYKIGILIKCYSEMTVSSVIEYGDVSESFDTEWGMPHNSWLSSVMYDILKQLLEDDSLPLFRKA
ncbi:hypothetical protein [Hymenobacter guriensis]|uniref:Uncharacterized protein n=1 Tax=Hymenobacter guriensis TaxID=2793065 RepID=A0ABS0L405_9BACT|nr:hypothetical protein [Hymenobacter guriensis]MBG8554859.1 hypothetical protein [Hymenobacter guriensis]